MYDSRIGQWLSEDPIGFDARDANLRRYVLNNPVNMIDPNGLDGIGNGWGMREDPEARKRRDAGQARLRNNLVAYAKRYNLPPYLVLWLLAEERVEIRRGEAGASRFLPHSDPCLEYEEGTFDDLDATQLPPTIASDAFQIWNELLHAWWHFNRHTPEAQWIRELMDREFGDLVKRRGGVAWGVDIDLGDAKVRSGFIEEAMSETMASIASHLAFQAVSVKKQRRSVPIGPNSGINCPAAHDGPGEQYGGVKNGLASVEISNTLTIAVLWIMENGSRDPRLGQNISIDQALQDWYDKRWSPTRPKDSRVDRIGNPITKTVP